jgi:hypothetical protein
MKRMTCVWSRNHHSLRLSFFFDTFELARRT